MTPAIKSVSKLGKGWKEHKVKIEQTPNHTAIKHAAQ